MAFNINAHVILSGPKNLKKITKKIERRLGTVKTRIRLDVPKNLSKQIKSFNTGLKKLSKNVSSLQSSTRSANKQLQILGNQLNSLNKSSTAVSRSQSAENKFMKFEVKFKSLVKTLLWLSEDLPLLQ